MSDQAHRASSVGSHLEGERGGAPSPPLHLHLPILVAARDVTSGDVALWTSRAPKHLIHHRTGRSNGCFGGCAAKKLPFLPKRGKPAKRPKKRKNRCYLNPQWPTTVALSGERVAVRERRDERGRARRCRHEDAVVGPARGVVVHERVRHANREDGGRMAACFSREVSFSSGSVMCDARRSQAGGGGGCTSGAPAGVVPGVAITPGTATRPVARGGDIPRAARPRGSPRWGHLGIFFGKTEPKQATSLTQQAKVSQKSIIKTDKIHFFRPDLEINAAL